jgi:hypothetical protein
VLVACDVVDCGLWIVDCGLWIVDCRHNGVVVRVRRVWIGRWSSGARDMSRMRGSVQKGRDFGRLAVGWLGECWWRPE